MLSLTNIKTLLYVPFKTPTSLFLFIIGTKHNSLYTIIKFYIFTWWLNKNIYIIGRKDDKIFFKNLSVPNSFVIVKNIKEIPSWIDNVYAKERLEEKKIYYKLNRLLYRWWISYWNNINNVHSWKILYWRFEL